MFVHGNPTWLFEFRRVIRELRSEFRCVALDHIGFGLSSRSSRREDHHPESHAQRFAALLDDLDLPDITLFMNDWGGPIGLDFARRQPERVRRLVIANTWCRPVGDDFHFKAFSFLMSDWIGQYLIRHRNMFVNTVMPRAVGDRSVLTPEIMAHYRNAQPSPAARAANAALPGHIVGAGDWLRSIWDNRSAFADKPAALLWDLKDIAFRRKELERWSPRCRTMSCTSSRTAGTFSRKRRPTGSQPRFGISWGGRDLDPASEKADLRVCAERRNPSAQERRPAG